MVHLTAVFAAAMAICGRKDTAEDLVQAAFLKAFENFSSFKKGTNCRAWLMRILRNTWVDQLRRSRFAAKQLPLEEEIAAPAPAVAETTWSNAADLLENFSDQQVIDALNRLPQDQRLTLYLIDVEGFSQQEVAEVTEVAVGTVKSRTSRARQSLKKSLEDYAEKMRFTGGGR